MSLIVPLGVNSFQPDAGLITIRRITGSDEPDSQNRYAYEVRRQNLTVLATGAVTHRYGDGALRLLQTVLNAALTDPTDEETTRG